VVKEYRAIYKANKEGGTMGLGRRIKETIYGTKRVVYLETNPLDLLTKVRNGY